MSRLKPTSELPSGTEPWDNPVQAPDVATIRTLRSIVARAPRPDEEPHGRLEGVVATAEDGARGGKPPEAFVAGWRNLVTELLLSTSDVAVFFPRHCAEFPELTALVGGLTAPATELAERAAIDEARRGWLADQSDLTDPVALVPSLLSELATADFRAGGWELLSRYLRFKDALYGHLVEPSWRPLQRSIFDLLDLQGANWPGSYVGGYAYQGYARIGISGVKPIEARLDAWDIGEYLAPGARVLDIGSNCGFLAVEIARSVGRVEAIELNPYLVLIGRAVQDELDVRNVEFVRGDFTDHELPGGFDVVLSLANHQTIDRNMAMPFTDYIAKIFSLLRPGGILLFESHNVFGPGLGGPGDDGDLDAKFDIAGRYFEVVRYRMTSAFVPGDLDVDKLFVVMRRREAVDENALRTFDLATARQSYEHRRP